MSGIMSRHFTDENGIIDKFAATIASDLDQLARIRPQIAQLLEANSISSDDIGNIGWAVEEAVANALKHGNRMDPLKTVRIQCSIFADKVRIEVEDQGQGFQLDEARDATADENLELPNGRGILMMKMLMDVVEYHNDENLLVLEKKRHKEQPAATSRTQHPDDP